MCRHGRQSWDIVESWPVPLVMERYEALMRLIDLEAESLED
jgi:hypothetical protein